jgi:hypothetical protein
VQSEHYATVDGGHLFPFVRIEKDTLDWFDKYLGAVK